MNRPKVDEYGLLVSKLEAALTLTESLTDSTVRARIRYVAELQGRFRAATWLLVQHLNTARDRPSISAIEAVRELAKAAGLSTDELHFHASER